MEERQGWQRNYVTIESGEQIRYTLFKREESGMYYVRFKGKGGERTKETTGEVKKSEAIDAAHRLILGHYGEEEKKKTERLTWDEAKEKLKAAMRADNKREKTITGYLETLDKLIKLCPKAEGPCDISEQVAATFKAAYATGERKAKSQDSRIRTLKALFGWFVKMNLIAFNPFENVAPPKLDRQEVKYVGSDDITAFFDWLNMRFPGWRMPHLFFQVKALTACRLEDICHLQSEQLQDGRLVFSARTTKNRSGREAILPAELYQQLEAYKGDTWLWELYPTELIAVNKAKGYPTHRQNPEFAPRRLYLWIVQIMGDYQNQTGNDLSSHDFRRAAFTRVAEKDVHPKRAAVAFDVTAETMLKYYTATEKRKTADEVLSDLADDLLPGQ